MIGKRIQDYRMFLRLKVGEFAKLIGISQGSLSDIENIKTKPSADTIAAIVRNTDIRPEWLLTGEGPMRKGDFQTGSGGSFSPDHVEVDQDLMWKVIEKIHLVMLDLGIDPKKLPEDKRNTIRDLVYYHALYNGCPPDAKYTKTLYSLTYSEACEEAKSTKTKDGESQTTTAVESQVTQTIGGKSNKVAGRDFVEGRERVKK